MKAVTTQEIYTRKTKSEETFVVPHTICSFWLLLLYMSCRVNTLTGEKLHRIPCIFLIRVAKMGIVNTKIPHSCKNILIVTIY